MKNHLLAWIFCFFATAPIFSQTQVQLSIPDVFLAAGDSTCVAVVADSFPDIAAAQFSLGWDTTIVSYNGLTLAGNPLGLSASNFFSPQSGVLNFSWFNLSGSGITVASGTPLFEICFTTIADSGTTNLFFGADISTEFIQAGAPVLFPSTLQNGSITITSASNLSVLPGDTNLDSLVNADDILNIGLGFGANGPSRIDAQTDFEFQQASAWASTTPISLVDYAHLDTDGNGTIDEEDASVVLANHGESMLNFAPDQPAVAQSAVLPFIYTADAPIEGGQMASIPVFLGDDANPVNPGYGLAFSIQFSPAQFDLSSISVDFNGSFLGSNLITFAELYPNEAGLLEIAAVRKDQQNSSLAGGLICTINIQSIAPNANEQAALAVTPYRYIDAEENETPLLQAISEFTILAPTSLSEPSWAASVSIAPNPSTNGLVRIKGLASEVAKVELADAQGRILQSFANGSSAIDISAYPNGVYFLRIFGRDDMIVRKLILRQ